MTNGEHRGFRARLSRIWTYLTGTWGDPRPGTHARGQAEANLMNIHRHTGPFSGGTP